MTAAALVAIVAAMLLVRLGWGGRPGAAAAGGLLATGALLALARDTGAWGLAMGVVTGTAAAIGLVLYAGYTSPAKTRRPSRAAPSITLPHRAGDFGRRLAVFVLVVPVAFAAAQWLAFGVQALARAHGAAAADTTALILFLQPLLWSGLMAWQMTRAAPARMVAAPAGAAIVGTLLWSLA